MLLIDRVVTGGAALFGGLALDHLAANKLGNDAINLVILIRRFLAGARDDQRGAGLVDQDRVYLIDDGIVVAALDAIGQVELHVVAQVVEAELVIRAVSDVGGVTLAPLLVIQVVNDHPNRQAQKLVELSHPLGV